MTNHLKVYCKGFSIEKEEVICEITGRPAIQSNVDIHHLIGRGMGGRPEDSADIIENLMAIQRVWHDFIEMNPKYYWWFQLAHFQYMITRKPYHETKASIDDPIFDEIKEKIYG